MGNLIKKSNDHNNKQLSADNKIKEEENNIKRDTLSSSSSSPPPAATTESAAAAAGGAATTYDIGQSLDNNNTSTSARSNNRKIESATKLFNFRKISSWSLGSFSQRINLSGLIRKSTNSISFSNTTKRTHSQKYQKSVWPSSLKDSLFSSHFKRITKNNDYRIESVVANGAFGVVLKVVNTDTASASEKREGNYAIKVLEKSRIVEDNGIQQIKNEIDIQKLCSHHPFIVKYFDCWQNRSNLFILLEYVSCGELFMKIKSFPYELIQLYVAEIAAALGFLHNAGVIYRDVKPENILLNYNYHIKLTDFGLSKWLKFGNKTKTICGTFQYMGTI